VSRDRIHLSHCRGNPGRPAQVGRPGRSGERRRLCDHGADKLPGLVRAGIHKIATEVGVWTARCNG
jgi:hypothetical protein